METLTIQSGLTIPDPLQRLTRFCEAEYEYYDGVDTTDPNHVQPVEARATIAVNSYINNAAKLRTVHRGLAELCDPLLPHIPWDADIRPPIATRNYSTCCPQPCRRSGSCCQWRRRSFTASAHP
jgi:hypothetical protein